MKITNLKTKLINILKTDRPWGYMLNFAENVKCTCKILFVKKGEMLSLQYHFKRQQFYFIIDDGFRIYDGRHYVFANAGDMFFFDLEVVHRAEFIGSKVPNLIIKLLKFLGISLPGITHGRYLEIAFGEYEEKDIVRLDDKYGRYSPTPSGH